MVVSLELVELIELVGLVGLVGLIIMARKISRPRRVISVGRFN
jgi:hypothetical protein